MSDTNSPTLNDAQSARLDRGADVELVVRPNDRFDQFLPVATTAEQEHQAKCPDEVSAQEDQAVGRQSRTVGVDYLRSLRPEEVTQPTINGDGSQAYDFIYVEDIARSNIAALKSDV